MDDPLDGIRTRFSRLYPPHIDVGRGWHGILIALDAELTTIDPTLRYVQIKEKFGGLRVYTTPTTSNAVRRAKRRAQDEALRTCESCGRAGTMHSRMGWYRTLCPSCAAEAEYVRVPDERMSKPLGLPLMRGFPRGTHQAHL